MTIIKEFRIVMPLTLEEYHIGQLYTVIEMSKETTGGGDGIEWLENRPFDDKELFNGAYTTGQYTRKVYHMSKKLPAIINKMLSDDHRKADEDAWNAFPYCRVEIKPRYTPTNFNVYIESMHLADRGTTENALNLPPDMLAKRQVVVIDLVKDTMNPKDYKVAEDPAKFHSKSGRGQLQPNWKETCEPVMCCYKLVHVQCTWTVTGGMIEGFIVKQYPRMFLNFHRKMFCLLDKWSSLNVEDIRKMEAEAMQLLKKQRLEGPERGPLAV